MSRNEGANGSLSDRMNSLYERNPYEYDSFEGFSDGANELQSIARFCGHRTLLVPDPAGFALRSALSPERFRDVMGRAECFILGADSGFEVAYLTESEASDPKYSEYARRFLRKGGSVPQAVIPDLPISTDLNDVRNWSPEWSEYRVPVRMAEYVDATLTLFHHDHVIDDEPDSDGMVAVRAPILKDQFTRVWERAVCYRAHERFDYAIFPASDLEVATSRWLFERYFAGCKSISVVATPPPDSDKLDP